MHTSLGIATTALLIVLAACGLKGSGESRASTAAGGAAAPAAESSGGMPGMRGMPGMGGQRGAMMMSDSTMHRMQAHMWMMDTVSAARMKAMLPEHRQMVANMLAQMNAEIRSMKMAGDPAWNATVDSVRQDLVHMPEMSAVELQRLMPAHAARVMRLMSMHQQTGHAGEARDGPTRSR